MIQKVFEMIKKFTVFGSSVCDIPHLPRIASPLYSSDLNHVTYFFENFIKDHCLAGKTNLIAIKKIIKKIVSKLVRISFHTFLIKKLIFV